MLITTESKDKITFVPENDLDMFDLGRIFEKTGAGAIDFIAIDGNLKSKIKSATFHVRHIVGAIISATG